MKNFFKFLVAIFLLPFVFWITVESVLACWQVFQDFKNTVEFLAGAALYCIIHKTVYSFERIYVFGHEMTHAIVAMLFGYRVHELKINKDSGHVKMDRCNMVVALAPYCVPFYVLLLGVIYTGASLFFAVENYRAWFVFATGFLMTFHFVKTFQTLWESQQPDLKMAGGKVFSVVMILLCNALLFVLVLKCLFPDKVQLLEMLRHCVHSTCACWQIVINYIVRVFAGG